MFLKKKFNNFKNFIKRWEILVSLWITLIAVVIMYSYFLSWNETTRDATRYSDLIKINDELKIYYSKNNTYPIADNTVNITSSWEILTYQWYLWENVFKELWVKEIKDPKKEKKLTYYNYYTYATDSTKQKFQLMTFYESEKNNKYTPTTNRKAYNYGDKVWIAIENKTTRPIQETKLWFDVFNTNDIYTIYLDNKTKIIWDKTSLKNFIADTINSRAYSCLDIKKSWINKDWYYYINPLFDSNLKIPKKTLKVYCDMTSDWGWWTRLYYKDWIEKCSNDDNYFNPFIIEKLLTKDFAVSDKKETLKSEWSWILKDIDFNEQWFSKQKMANVANCNTPNWENWSKDYNKWYLTLKWTLSTMWKWTEMFSGCEFYKKVWEKLVVFNIWWIDKYWMTWEFIHTLCNNYSQKDHSITSKWDWDNTRVIWVR